MLALFLQPVTRRGFPTEQAKFWVRIKLGKNGKCFKVRIGSLRLIFFCAWALSRVREIMPCLVFVVVDLPRKNSTSFFLSPLASGPCLYLQLLQLLSNCVKFEDKEPSNDPHLNPGPTSGLTWVRYGFFFFFKDIKFCLKIPVVKNVAFYKMLDPIRNSGILELISSFTLKGKIINKYRFKFVHFSVLLKISMHNT